MKIIKPVHLVYKDPHSYCSHPNIALLSNGDWIVVFCQTIRREPYLHPPSDPRFYNLLIRSSDQGETWSQPWVVPDYSWYGVETPGIAQLSNGEILLNQWQFHWYPLPLGKKLWKDKKEAIFICDSMTHPHTHDWRLALTESDFDNHPYPWVRSDNGAFVHISHDGGKTFEQTVSVDIIPYQGAFSPNGTVEVGTGELVLALGSHDHDPLAATFIVKSRDNGRSWQKPIPVAQVPGLIFSEPSLVNLGSNQLLVFSREEKTGVIHMSTSSDLGTSWSSPEKLPFWGYPTQGICLADGRVLIVFGRRKTPFGIRAAISKDQGKSWGEEIILCNDLPNSNLGYPSVIEYESGKLYCVYYGETSDEITCIQGIYFSVE